MKKAKVKTEKISGFRIAVMSISILMLSFIMAFSMLFGISMMKTMKTSSGPNATLDKGETTIRKQLPAGDVSPVESTALDNIGYMAYTMDHQSYYHAYAHNQTQAVVLGGFKYNQITQSWKDYKSAQYSGEPFSVMVASDLSYSQFAKSATQSCFLGDNKAIIREGSKPSGNKALPFDIEWSTGNPTVFDADGYRETYGEFSTEISVYVINEKTLEGADEVVELGDGIFKQTYYLNANAGGWYQYGMKTRGGFKKLPEFKSIIITFTFNDKWEILESYCEEKAVITPGAIGGTPVDSNSITTTVYDYSLAGFSGGDRYEELHGGDFDCAGHYDYYNDFFIQYKDAEASGGDETDGSVNILDLLGNGFAGVLTTGQQFDLSITLGETDYVGKVFLKLGDTNDILNSLEVKLSLGKSAGKQDLYVELQNGNVGLYYSNDFALSANINEVKDAVNNIIDWVNGIGSTPASPDAAGYAMAVDEEVQPQASSGLDLGSLLNSLKLVDGDDEVSVILQSDDLLGLGIGVDAVLVFNKFIDEYDTISYSFKSASLNSIEYNNTTINLNAAILPDDSGVEIARKSSETCADLADYIDSVYDVLTSDAIRVEISLGDKLIKGLSLDVIAYVVVGSDIAANVSITACYNDISVMLDAAYVYEGSSYGKIYLHVKEVNGQSVNAKIFCDIGDTVTAVKDIIALFSSDSGISVAAEEAQSQDTLANIINNVLNLNFAKVIGKVIANEEVISVEIDVDEILAGLGVDLEKVIKDTGIDLGIEDYSLGKLSLEIAANGTITGSLSNLGLGLEICGWDDNFTVIEDKLSYVDLGSYIESVSALLQKPAYDVEITFDGAEIAGIDLTDLKLQATATVAVEGDVIRVQLPATVKYDVFEIALTAYYTINLSNGGYGDIYLNVTGLKIDDKAYTLNAKVYCAVDEVVDSVMAIIDKFTAKSADIEDDGVSTQSDEEEKSILAKAIELLLSLNYNEIVSATNEKLSVMLDVDDILSALDISLGGVSFGELNLAFVPAEGKLSGNLDDLGLTVAVSGNDEELAAFDTDGYVNLQAYLNSIVELLNKNSFNFSLTFVGNKNIKSDIDLTGLKADIEAQLALVDNFGGAEVNISKIKVSYLGLSIELSAHYEVSFDGGYGVVYLNIDKINDVGMSVKVKANIEDAVDAVTAIIDSFKTAEPQTYAEETEEKVVSEVVKAILKLDLQELLNSLKAYDDLAELNLNLDNFLAGFNLGVNLGTINLKYYPADCTLMGSDEYIGLSLIQLKGSDEKLSAFEEKGYLDAVQAIKLVEDMIAQGRDIADAKAILFNVNIDAKIDGKAVKVVGDGEVVWGETVKVALSLLVNVDNEDKFELNFVYNPDDKENLVILTLNELGTTIPQNDIDNLVKAIKDLIDLFSGNNPTEPDGELVAPDEGDGYALSVGGVSIEEILADETVKKVLAEILGFINEFTVEIQNVGSVQDIYNLVVKHTGGLTITLGTDDCLFIEIAEGSKYTARASVEAGDGTRVSDKHAELVANEEGKYELLTLSEFVKKLYDNFFEEIENATLSDILGEAPYLVKLTLTGADSAIGALEAVTISADLYYAEGILVDDRATKLMQADLNINIGGTEVKALVSYQGRMVFIELSRIGSTILSGIKFKTEVGYIFDAVEQLVRLITDTNLVKTIGKLMGNGQVDEGDIETIAAFAALSTEDGESAPSALSKLIDAILSLNFEEAFKFDKENKSAQINIDSLSQALLGVDIGTVKASADSEQHKFDLTVAVNGNENAWLELHAAPCAAKENALSPDDFMDVGFLAILLSDLKGFATSGGSDISTLFTFTGSINLDLAGILAVEFNNAKLSAGLDDGKFYFSMTADTNGKLLGDNIIGDLLGRAVIENSTISLTYADGLLVLGRNVNDTGKAEFRVLTLDYLLDNLLSGDNIIKWFIGINSTVWGLVSGAISGVNISSGLPKPGEYYLYDQSSGEVGDSGEVEESNFALSDYLSAMDIRLGDYSSSFGDASKVLSGLGLDSDKNHYAFDINAQALVGDMIPTLYAALLRDGNGLSGLKAYGELSTFAKFSLSFTNKTADQSVSPVINYLAHVTDNYRFDKDHYKDATSNNHKTEIFGCYTTNGVGQNGTYSSSYLIDTVTLEVYDVDGNLEKTLDVIYGSTVYLLEGDVNLDADHRFIYVDATGANLGKVVVVKNEADNSVVTLFVDNNNVARIYASSVTTVNVQLIFIGVKNENIVGTLGSETLSSVWVGDPIGTHAPIDEYSFAGWFKDEALTIAITAVPDGIPVYGKFVESTVVGDNGVVYKFDSNELVYYVSGGDGDKITKYYSSGALANEWLVIRSEINGCKVGYIGASAFERTDSNNNDKKANSLVNVFVPETITAVYDKAFRDNKELKNVVFCADIVFFSGRADGDNNKASVFYGCYPGSESDNNNFTVYYNYHDYENDPINNPYPSVSTPYSDKPTDAAWNRIYFNKPLLSSQTTYVMATKGYKDPKDTAHANDWAFAEYEFDLSAIGAEYSYLNAAKVFAFGLDFVVRSQSEIASEAIKAINILTAEHHDFINGFSVSISGDTVLGKYTKVVITLTENTTKDYRFNYNLDGGAFVEDLISVDYLAGYFATEGKTYYIVPKDGYEITSVSGVEAKEGEDGKWYFTMPAGLTEIETFSKTNFSHITLNSDIPFILDGNSYDSFATVDKQEGDAMVSAALSQSDYSEYVFIGWAYYDGTNYILEGGTVNYSVYYAIWAYQREEITSLSVSGTTLNATVDSSKANSVYGWYADEDFNSEIALCNGNLATFTAVPSTILYARLNFTLSVTVKADGNAHFYYFDYEDWDKNEKGTPTGDDCADGYRVVKGGSTDTYTATFIVKEMQSVCIEIVRASSDSANNCLKITIEDKAYYIRLKINTTTGGVGGSGEFKELSVSNGESFNMTAETSVTVKNGANCIATGSLITLADGSKKRIEDLTGSEMLLAWDFVTGTYVEAQIAFIFYHGDTEYEVVNLVFADGTVVRTIGSHAFFDYQLNDFAFISTANYADYIGHEFNKSNGDSYEFVELVDAYVTVEYTGSYSIQTVIYDNFFVEDMLSITPPMYEGLFFFFEYGDNMKYDEAKMQADIEEYGLFTYEELKEYLPQLTYEQFIAFNGAYLKVAIGKNLLTIEQLIEAAAMYLPQ